ncbi:MAG: hypothetical protein BA863_18865 [Desulfovibrio sp. S3730MH75]|nr:MAG: hypothetical protein BA863_18865 [Desulfovibrio sp. S3730MH75]
MFNVELQQLLAEVFEIRQDEIVENLTSEDVDNWDSLKQMDLVVSLENKYNIALSFEEIVKISSVKDIIDVLSAKDVL